MENKTPFIALASLLLGAAIPLFFIIPADNIPNFQTVNTTEHTADMNMDEMMDSMLAELEGKTGDDFDQAFISEMIIHHQGAVIMAEEVLKNSTRPELINLAYAIITAQTQEIEMMQTWQQEWFQHTTAH